MYASDDPRSALNKSVATSPVAASEFAPAEYAKFHETDPQEKSDGVSTWYARGQNFIVAYSEIDGTAEFSRPDQADEYVVLLPANGVELTLHAGRDSQSASEPSLIVMPPGASRITATGKGRLVRLFTSKAADLAALCSNAASYARAHPNIPPFQPWPEPPAGYAIRRYPLDVPAGPGRFGCIYRCTTFMVNFFEVKPPRDPANLSPHFHDDFEQCSLALQGSYIHHIRWPWVTNSAQWLEDDHEVCPAPSIAVIPPPSLHTSQGTDPAGNLLVDIFCPPRLDFSLKAGWVLNADDYPMPPAE